MGENFDKLGLSWLDDFISSLVEIQVESKREEIIDSVIQTALGERSANTDITLTIESLDASNLSIKYKYSDAYTFWLIPLGSGTGTYDPSGLVPGGGEYSHYYQRTEPEIYTVLDESSTSNFNNAEFSFVNTIGINQDFNSWLNFSSIHIDEIYIMGDITLNGKLTRDTYKKIEE